MLSQGELNDLTEDVEDADESESPGASPVKEKEIVQVNPSAVALLSLLEERLKMYQTAEANAKSIGETSRARR